MSPATADATEVVAQVAGVTVNVPYSALSSPDASIRVETGPPPSDALASFGPGIEALGDGADVELTGGKLVGSATVAFDLPVDFDVSRYTAGVVWETDTGWELLPVAWRPGDRQVIATAHHFSFGFPVRIDWSEAANSIVGWVEGLVTGRANIDNPACGDERAARESGIEVVSDGGDLIKWCFGRENGRDVLKISNNWNAGVQVQVPKSWNVVEYQGAGASPQAIGDWLDSASRETSKTISRLIGSGQTIALEPSALDAGEGARVVAEISTVSWLWSIALQGVDMYLLTLKWLAVDKGSVRTEDLLTGGAFIKCFTDHYGGDIAASTSPIAPESFTQLVADTTLFALDCGEDVVRDYLGTFDGFAARVAGVAIGVIAAAVGTVHGLINAAFAGIRALIDEIGSLFDDSDVGSSGYDIVINRAEGSPSPNSYDDSRPYWIVSMDLASSTMRVQPVLNWYDYTDLRYGDVFTVNLDPAVEVHRTMSGSTINIEAFAAYVNSRNPGTPTELADLVPSPDGSGRVGVIFPWLDGGTGEGVDWEYCTSIGKGPDDNGELQEDCSAATTSDGKITSCEGLDTSLVPDTRVNIVQSVCSYPWALVAFTEPDPRLAVALIRTDPQSFLTYWVDVEDGPEYSGYSIESIASYGVPAESARAMWESLGGPTAGN